jgi:hypothetical protein
MKRVYLKPYCLVLDYQLQNLGLIVTDELQSSAGNISSKKTKLLIAYYKSKKSKKLYNKYIKKNTWKPT